MQEEIWRDIPEWEGIYAVSNLGHVMRYERTTRVKGVKRNDGKCRDESWTRPARLLKPIASHNVLFIRLYDGEGRRYRRSIKKLVAESFLPDFDASVQTAQIKCKDSDWRNVKADNLYIKRRK